MDRQAVIEATIDYVMTKLRHRRSVGPAWIRYQDREVSEASIDSVTPGLYRSALKVNREVNKPFYKRKPISFTAKDNRVKSTPGFKDAKTTVKVRRPIGLPKKLNDAGFGGFAHPVFKAIVVPKGDKKATHATKNVATHELVHLADKAGFRGAKQAISKRVDKAVGDAEGMQAIKKAVRVVKSEFKGNIRHMADLSAGETKATAKYVGNPMERHAYSAVAGTLGVRHMKKAGLSRNKALSTIAKGNHGDNPYADTAQDLFKSVKDTTKQSKRSYRKLGKEMVKGVDRYYGSRGKTVGRNKIGVPIRKLPESDREILSRAVFEKVIEDVTGAKSFNQAARQAIKKPAAGTFKPKWDQNKRQPIKPLPRHRSMTEEAVVTHTERIGPKLWKTKKPKAKVLKFKSKPKSVRSRAELTDKLTKKQVATKGKVKAVAKQLPSYVAAKKGKLGIYLAKHSVHRDMVKRARGKSRLPEGMMNRQELIAMLTEVFTPPRADTPAPKDWDKQIPFTKTRFRDVKGEIHAGWRKSKDPMLADRWKKLHHSEKKILASAAGWDLHRDIKHEFQKRRGYLYSRAREGGIPADSREISKQASLFMPKKLMPKTATGKLSDAAKGHLANQIVMRGRSQRLRRNVEKRGGTYTPALKAKVTRQMRKNRKAAWRRGKGPRPLPEAN